MSRIGLAFSSFFRLLFGKQLRPEAATYLPEDAIKALLPEPAKAEPAKTEPAKAQPAKAEPAIEKPVAPKKPDGSAQRDGALALLALLQREGRLVDFLREPLESYADADIGAAARDVHRGCKKVLEQCFTLEAVMPGEEDAKVSVPKGFDPGEVRLIGEARGEAPFAGTLRHHGWRATKTQLPSLADGVDRAIVAPAEVEV
ncbi:MAG: DUF2760 domain-containing protein [Deltaproteobacteria bacterium]|nr:DUF2760 domain-containing protein [Kofleriaceae bacterium]